MGKGRRERLLPLWKQTCVDLRAWLAVRGPAPATELFVNARGQPLTRSGFEYILNKYVQTAAERYPVLKQRHISPHSLRHSAAMMVLQATGDIRKVSLWLGHADIQTTEIYLRAEPNRKAGCNERRCAALTKKRTVPGARQTDRLAAGRLNMLSDGSRHGRQHKAPTPAILHIPGLCISQKIP